MFTPTCKKAFAAWFALMLTAIANGAFRAAVLSRVLNSADAHFVSTLLGSTLLLGVIWLLIPWIAPHTTRETVTIGTLWVILTVTFEFTFGHYVAHQPWAVLLADYNIIEGRIWPLVLLTVAAAPYATARLRGLLTPRLAFP